MNKKTTLFFFSCIFIFCTGLTSCSSIQEITINKNESGVHLNTINFSSILGMSGDQGQDLSAIPAVDTTILLKNMDQEKSSSLQLTSTEKKLIDNGTIKTIMDYVTPEGKFIIHIPFAKLSELTPIADLSTRILTLESNNSMNDMPEGMPAIQLPASLYSTTIKRGLIEVKYNESMAPTVYPDELRTFAEEMTTMANTPISLGYIINLPSPAKEISGKFVSPSNDKRTVTLNCTLQDFYENPAALNFKITY